MRGRITVVAVLTMLGIAAAEGCSSDLGANDASSGKSVAGGPNGGPRGAEAGAPTGPPRYDDGVKNGAETDVDCGGDPAHPCATRQRCEKDTDCSSRVCGRVGDRSECLVARSCAGGPGAYFDCGPDSDESCCLDHPVPGGSFKRFNNALYPAKVSPFRLDAFEITAGRFRAWVTATGGNLRASAPAAGAGAHPKVPGSGWRTEWNVMLPESTEAVENLGPACSAGGTISEYGARTYWTEALEAEVKALVSDVEIRAANSKEALDKKPLNCTPWFVLYAFCIWDGGRLPSLAEWTFAAQGGDEQRPFPWGSLAPATLAPWNNQPEYYAPIPTFEAGEEFGAFRLWDPPSGANAWPDPYLHTWGGPYRVNGDNAAHIMPVGHRRQGKAKWGHYDMAGNVHEWLLDEGPVTAGSCDDCANVSYPPLDKLDPAWPITGWEPEWYRGGRRILTGGSWENSSYISLTFSDYLLKEAFKYPVRRTYAELGARCARDVR